MILSQYLTLLAFAGVNAASDRNQWSGHGQLDHGEPGHDQHGYGRPPFDHGQPQFGHGQPDDEPCTEGIPHPYPSHPSYPSQPWHQSQPSNPSRSSYPSQPSNSSQPTNSRQPTNPSQPTNPVQPTNPSLPLNQSQPLQNTSQRVSGQSWPYLPFTTSGRDIINAAGNKVVYAGVNWPGALETMLPEGLQYNSVATIVGKIKSLGMNVIRLTYAIEMIDDHFANSPNSTLQATLSNALGATVGASVLSQILENNPQFTANTTRLQVFDAVAAECAKQEVYVHLDNHVSKAVWCCFVTDGNSWFNDTYFDVNRWQRGLGFMADHAKSWAALASMSLRNELRPAQDGDDSALTYGWEEWYDNMIPAAEGIHSNNSSPLIFLSGLAYDSDVSPLVNKKFTLDGTTHFDPSAFDFSNKLVLELHDYQGGAAACSDITETLYGGGYGAMNVSDSLYHHVPVVLTEFGFGQIDGSSEGVYAQCIKDYLTSLPGGPGGWMQWLLSGSYYVRQGTANYDEVWGLTNRNWTTWRNQTVIDNYVKPFVADTLNP